MDRRASNLGCNLVIASAVHIIVRETLANSKSSS